MHRIAIPALRLAHALALAAALAARASADSPGLTTPGAGAPLVAAGTTVPALCAGTNPFAIAAGLNGNPAPCAIAPRSFVLEAIYLQNASRVGGTALAAYPLVSVHAGILPRLQFTFDAPSEIAQSRPGGGGAFPITHLGYGLTYTVAETDRVATALVTEVLPPDSRFTVANAQSRYSLGLASDVSLTSKWTLGATGAATSSSRAGFGLLLPSLDVTAGYAPNAHTQFVTGLGTRIVSRRAVSQSFTDIAVNQILDKKLFFMVGLGTTFNAVDNTKPHYLATGFTYRP